MDFFFWGGILINWCSLHNSQYVTLKHKNKAAQIACDGRGLRKPLRFVQYRVPKR